MSGLFDGEVIGRLREAFVEGCKRTTGTTCPVCDRHGHYDGRPLNVVMVRSLAWLWRLSDGGRDWVHVPEALAKLRDTNASEAYAFTKQYSTSRRWGFLDQRERDRDSKTPKSGVWRPTPLAGQFLRGEVSVPAKVWTYNSVVITVSLEVVRVGDVVGGFDYWEMMATPFPGPE